jgi:hypothetical protein
MVKLAKGKKRINQRQVQLHLDPKGTMYTCCKSSSWYFYSPAGPVKLHQASKQSDLFFTKAKLGPA